MNRIFQAEVILTLTREQAEWLLFHLDLTRRSMLARVLPVSDVVEEQAKRQGVAL